MTKLTWVLHAVSALTLIECEFFFRHGPFSFVMIALGFYVSGFALAADGLAHILASEDSGEGDG